MTLGECRSLNKWLDAIVLEPALPKTKLISLPDNQPIAGASQKGRSPSGPVNYVLRRKSARALSMGLRVILPWVEACKMPADWLSRSLAAAARFAARRW